MSSMGLISIDQLESLVNENQNLNNGCILDTNILISASLPIDPKNDDAEKLIQKLAQLKIPIFSNVNIRSEFLEIQRRVLIPEALIEFYEDSSDLEDLLAQKLKSVQSSYRKSIENKKIYKFSDDRIKEFRKLFSSRSVNNQNGWDYFCERYLAPQLEVAWDEVVQLCGLNFIKIRDGEVNPYLVRRVSWSGAVNLMGKFGIGSADAMILNLLLSSTFEIVATADGDIQYLS